MPRTFGGTVETSSRPIMLVSAHRNTGGQVDERAVSRGRRNGVKYARRMSRFALPLAVLIACGSCSDPRPSRPGRPTPSAPASSVSDAEPVDEIALAGEARAKASELAQRLQAQLQAAMASGGPSAAVKACQAVAPAVAAELSREGWTVRRTATRLRNPANAPDEWERAALSGFEQRLGAGEAAGELETFKLNRNGPNTSFRYAKAIVTRPVCTTCHGQAIAPAVVATLDELYPLDQARGFAEGSLRGMFSLTKRW
ncbi:MAG: DUF3365 domain-containing protein [Myxococcales bacterium FL481]|nr:MAG: DUF3365 domain-containing protein [Myxococcales bacterium FL481]